MGLVRNQKCFTRLSDSFIHSFSQSVDELLLSHLLDTVLGSETIKMNEK